MRLSQRDQNQIERVAQQLHDEWTSDLDGEMPSEIIMTSIGYVEVFADGEAVYGGQVIYQADAE